jgi:large subunit ribosomal protein L25
VSEIRIAVEPRTEFGKGAARRTRRAGKIPAVLYGHGTAPQHLALPALEFARVIRENGRNAVLTLKLNGQDSLALTKTVAVHPIRRHIEHVDLLVIRRGEKVVVEVSVVLSGEAVPGTLVTQDLDRLEVEADVLSIPENFEVSVEGAEIGTRVLAGDIELPDGVTLRTDPEYLVVNVVPAPTAEEMEGEVEGEAEEEELEEGAEPAAEGEAPAEGESKSGESSDE